MHHSRKFLLAWNILVFKNYTLSKMSWRRLRTWELWQYAVFKLFNINKMRTRNFYTQVPMNLSLWSIKVTCLISFVQDHRKVTKPTIVNAFGSDAVFHVLSEMLYKCALYLLLILMCYLKFFYANLICVTRFKYVDCLTYKPIGTYYHFFQLRKDFNHFIEVFYQYCPFSIIWVFI